VIIGVPREIKPGEQRVALTPAGVRALLEARQQVLVERGAGQGSSIRDEEYVREGASLVDVDEVWARAEMVLKVKEPLPEEYGRMRAATKAPDGPIWVSTSNYDGRGNPRDGDDKLIRLVIAGSAGISQA